MVVATTYVPGDPLPSLDEALGRLEARGLGAGVMKETPVREYRAVRGVPVRRGPPGRIVVRDHQWPEGIGYVLILQHPRLQAGGACVPVKMDNSLGIELLEMPSVELDEPLEFAPATFLLCLFAGQVYPAGLRNLLAGFSKGDVQLVLAISLDLY